jgi:thiamine biosynthesis lipoprotein
VSQALDVAKMTAGTWDPTDGKLVEVYKKANGKDPGPATVAAAKTKVGYFSLEARFDPLALKKTRHGLVLNLTALAQGYLVDEIAETMKKKGVSNFRVKMGPIVRAVGLNARGEVWPYSYQKPISAAQMPLHLTNEVVAVDNRGAATVSVPEAKDVGGQVFIDPRSGKPLQTDLLNVTILDLSALRALALASGLFTVGKTEAMILAKKNGIAAFFVSQAEEKGIAEASPLFPSPIKSTY